MSLAAVELEKEQYINLVTFRRDGRGVETPVWFVVLDGKLYVFTDGTSAKVKRLRATGRAKVAPCGMRGAVTGPWRDGTGRIVGESDLSERVYTALHGKYGWQMKLLDFGSRLGGRIGRRAVLELVV